VNPETLDNLDTLQLKAKLEDLQQSQNNMLVIFYNFLNHIIKFSVEDINVKEGTIFIRNEDLRQQLIIKAFEYAQISDISPSEFVERF